MITVYLDSQDYSILTDPKQLTPELNAIRDRLLAYARSDSVQFVFSGVVVCEAVPLTPDSGVLAAKKADFLGDLCGKNALISFDKLLSREIAVLLGKMHGPVDAVDPDGNWFPDVGPPDREGAVWERMEELIDEELKRAGMTRQQRRAKKRELIKNGQPRPQLQALLDQHDGKELSAALVAQYPMHPEHANLMALYGVGRASEEQFMDALTGSLRDPRWMMRWFATDHSLASPVSDIVRKPGREVGDLLRALVKISLEHANNLIALNPDELNPIGRNGEMTKEWANFQDRQIANVTKTLSKNWFHTDIADINIVDIDANCRGLSTMLRSLYSSAWESVGGGRKEGPSDSQVVDVLHALYAPYVDVFRADRFMSPHIERQVGRRDGTSVVAKLQQLPEAIEEKLSGSHSR